MASHGEAALPSRVKQLVDLTAGSMIVNRLVSLALNELPDAAILVFDTDMRVVLCRGAAITDNRMNPADFEGRLAAEALAPDRWELYRPLYEAALRGEPSEREVPSPDGTRVYLIRVEPVVDDAGVIMGGMLVATEITALREAQRQALASERRFALAMKVAPIGMAVVSLERVFVEVNRSLCQMLGAQPRDLIGESLTRIIHPDDEAADLQLRAAVLAGESEGITSEKRLGTSVMDVGLYGHSGLRAWSESKDWFEPYSPSTDPAQAWPIIERERIEWQWLPASNKAHQYGARKPSMGGINRTFCHDGPTILVAVMRCFVASRLGDEVDVPKELA